jgi:hypothetical protein
MRIINSLSTIALAIECKKMEAKKVINIKLHKNLELPDISLILGEKTSWQKRQIIEKKRFKRFRHQ